jgi:aerobic-type carbon monoxide dehydrogenase small subunit (CoxS/CutS family)
MKKKIAFVLNGNEIEVEVEPHWTLLHLLRESLELSGTKPGCGEGECGACTVLVNNKAVNSCIYPVMEVADATVTTIEGMVGSSGELHPIQQAFIERGAVQCGFCTPGMIMASRALLDENPNPTEDEIRHNLAGNLCRCTGYTQIIEAVEAARESLRKG